MARIYLIATNPFLTRRVLSTAVHTQVAQQHRFEQSIFSNAIWTYIKVRNLTTALFLDAHALKVEEDLDGRMK